jgi:hypothetical protein
MTASTEINDPGYNSHRVAAPTSPKRYSVRSLIFSAVCPRRASASFDSVLDAVEGAITRFLLVVLLAFVSGCYLALRLTLLKEAKKAFRDIGNTQRFAAMISVTALDRLENGDIDGTKRLLATNVSGYYRLSIKDDPFAIEPKLRETIEKTSEHSPVLKQMLATPSR